MGRANHRAPIVIHPPFISNELSSYLAKHWALILCFSGGDVASREATARMIRFTNWYCVKTKILRLDHHPFAKELQKQGYDLAQSQKTIIHHKPIGELANSGNGYLQGEREGEGKEKEEEDSNELFTANRNTVAMGGNFAIPALFVNKQFVGDMVTVQRLVDEKKFKDVIQFGFEWKDKPFSKALGDCRLPSANNDTTMFRSNWKGGDKLLKGAPMVSLPKFSRKHMDI